MSHEGHLASRLGRCFSGQVQRAAIFDGLLMSVRADRAGYRLHPTPSPRRSASVGSSSIGEQAEVVAHLGDALDPPGELGVTPESNPDLLMAQAVVSQG